MCFPLLIVPISLGFPNIIIIFPWSSHFNPYFPFKKILVFQEIHLTHHPWCHGGLSAGHRLRRRLRLRLPLLRQPGGLRAEVWLQVGGGKGDGGWRGWWWKTWERLILFICQNQSIMLNVIFDRFCAMVNNPVKFKNMVSCFLRFWFLFICWIVFFWMFVFESLMFSDAFLIFLNG